MRVSPLLVLIGVVVALVLTAGAAAGAYIGVRQIVLNSPIELPPPPQINAAREASAPLIAPTPTPGIVESPAMPGAPAAVTATPPVTATAPAAAPTWNDPKRVNILLLGIDQRPQETGPFRTDTIILLSVDPIKKTAAMLSIPRDVYVAIPGYQAPLSPNRINAANFIGDTTEYPGGGPALATRTVESLLGIKIQRYIVVNFEAFKTVIDALGPVTVCPESRIFDDQYPDTDTYGVITVEFQPGCQNLDSTKLLQYARVRHNAGDDFGRAKRQQEVIRAVREKALSLGGVSALIGQSGRLWDALAQNIKTNLTFEEVLQLANLAQDVKDIKSEVLSLRIAETNSGQLLLSTLPNGEQVLTPIAEEVFELVVRLFDSGAGVPNAGEAGAESAAVFVANGAGIDGLARTTADKLIGMGFSVVGIGNAEGVGLYGKSEIRVYNNKFRTARYLAQQLGLDPAVIVQGAEAAPPGVDIQLIVGKDLAGQ